MRDTINLWIGCAIYGIGMSSVWPTVFTLVEGFTVISGRVTSFLMFAAAFGEMVFPILWGFTTNEKHPIYFVIINFGITSGICLFAMILLGIGRLTNKFVSKRESIENTKVTVGGAMNLFSQKKTLLMSLFN
jgi:MFS family permease